MNYIDERKRVLAVAVKSLEKGLIHGTSGNVSMRIEGEEKVIITPSGLPYDTLTPDQLPIVDLYGKVIEGDLKPSSETPLHTAVYRARKNVNGIVHTHSMYATIFSILGEDIPVMMPPAAPYAPVPVAKFELPGSEELGQSVVNALGEDHLVVTMENHGLISCCPSIERALSGAEYVEETAQVAYLAKLINCMNPLPKEASDALRERALKGLAL